MSKYEEKMKALAVLKDAVDKVDRAKDAIDAFADALGLNPEKEKTVDLPKLAAMVAVELKMRPGCVYTVLTAVFDLIRERNLTVVMEDDDNDE